MIDHTSTVEAVTEAMNQERSVKQEENPSGPRSKIGKTEAVAVAEPTCKDCQVGRGYRPFLDYVHLCPLHAAAPDLLAALKELEDYYGASSVRWDAARAAIAKAEGKQ